VLTGIKPDMKPMIDETFGPVVPLMSFKEDEEAIAIANNTK
jgi:acyl-CoA reductase-like NAD-dependent aldehyde dehydrogenase